MALSKLSEKCKICPYAETCKHKRMELVGCLEPVAAESAQSSATPLLVKHDYRDIKIAENTTVTIDLEELKRKMSEEIYKKAGLGFFHDGC